MKVKRETIISAVAFLIVGMILAGLYAAVAKQSITQNKERHRYIAANQSNIIRDCIDTVLARVYTLSTLVDDNNGDTAFFDRQAENIYRETKEDTGIALKNIALAPDGVVKSVYPTTGNEALAGFDFMDESKKGNKEAVAAYQRGELVITNPFELVQGGTGLAGRLPVFLSNNGEKQFWGLVTVTMDFEELIETINLKTLSNMGIDYRLWYRDENGVKVEMDASEHIPEKPVGYEFNIDNLTWYLELAPSDGWIDYEEMAVVGCIIFAIALLIALLLLNRKQIKDANEKLRRLAHLDSLTSCYSRHYVNTILLNQRNGAWNDPAARYSLAIVDVDNFKSINDTYGHDTGDRALIAVAQVLEDNSKHANGDCVIRHGGDEFIILYNDMSRERFYNKLEAIVNDVRKIRFPDVLDMRLTVSIGGEHYEDSKSSLYYNMIQKADERLYEAKEKGRNQFVV